MGISIRQPLLSATGSKQLHNGCLSHFDVTFSCSPFRYRLALKFIFGLLTILRNYTQHCRPGSADKRPLLKGIADWLCKFLKLMDMLLYIF